MAWAKAANPKTGTISLRLHPVTLEKLDRVARKKGVNRSEYIRGALNDAVARDEKNTTKKGEKREKDGE